MSLRDLGIYSPLPKEHPAVGEKCWKCAQTIGAGTRTGLQPIETTEQTGCSKVRAKVVCATCYLKGREIGTPDGRRIVERILDGDGSPYPVHTTDGHQWTEEEVFHNDPS